MLVFSLRKTSDQKNEGFGSRDPLEFVAVQKHSDVTFRLTQTQTLRHSDATFNFTPPWTSNAVNTPSASVRLEYLCANSETLMGTVSLHSNLITNFSIKLGFAPQLLFTATGQNCFRNVKQVCSGNFSAFLLQPNCCSWMCKKSVKTVTAGEKNKFLSDSFFLSPPPPPTPPLFPPPAATHLLQATS